MPRVHIHSVEHASKVDVNINGKDQAKLLLPSAEAFSHKDETFVSLGHPANETLNPLIAAATLAFAEHRPLVISPDVVYSVILLGVSQHVASDPEKYKGELVSHHGKETLSVRDDSLVRGSWENDWGRSVTGISEQILSRIPLAGAGGVSGFFAAEFSTTGPAERVAHRAALMEVMASYYEYEFVTMCGIPYVDITGTKDDWLKLSSALDGALPRLDLSEWNQELQVIIEHIVRAYDQEDVEADAMRKDDLSFWQGMYYYNGPHGSGGVARVSGWLGKLFLYTKYGRNLLLNNEQKVETGGVCGEPFDMRGAEEEKPLRSTSQTPWKDEAFWAKVHEKSDIGMGNELVSRHVPQRHAVPKGVPLSDFPAGLTETPFLWKYLTTEIEMTLRAGLVGVMSDAELALKPTVGWVIGERR